MSDPNLLRSIPSVDRILRTRTLRELALRYPHDQLVKWAREAIQEFRTQVREGTVPQNHDALDQVTKGILENERFHAGSKIRTVLNATGILLHTNLGRAPLAERAVQRVIDSTQTVNIELNLQTGKRNSRGQHCVDLLCQLTGCEDAILTNNCAAATMMVLQTLAQQREVIISRGQLVEIGGGFRLPDVFRAAGVILREVGTTNRTYVRDYESARNDQTAAIMRVHHGNYKISGFVTEPTIAELVPVGNEELIPVIDDLGSGWLGDEVISSSVTKHDLSEINEPSVTKSVSSGADLTLFSGDKLFGGPQCGIILGKSQWIKRLRKSPLMRAMRLDKMALAALEATIEIHLQGLATQELPVFQMLFLKSETIRERCQKILCQIGDEIPCEITACVSQIGGGSMPDQSLPSFGVRILTDQPNQIATKLRENSPSIQARIVDDSVLLDLRTIPESSIELLANSLLKVCKHEEPKSEEV